MDKFAFNDIVFNVGVRVDVFDANQPVLKDPYLFFNARTVKEARALKASDPSQYAWVDIPESMGRINENENRSDKTYFSQSDR